MVEIRPALHADVASLLPLMEDFNRFESIEWHLERTEVALTRLLDDPSLGFVLLAQSGATVVGYCVVTYNYDLEFGGRDAFITEVYVAPEARRSGIARSLVRAVTARAEREGLTALHLAVRPENEPACRLYVGEGYEVVPRTWMTKVL